jgi:toxin FitB
VVGVPVNRPKPMSKLAGQLAPTNMNCNLAIEALLQLFTTTITEATLRNGIARCRQENDEIFAIQQISAVHLTGKDIAVRSAESTRDMAAARRRSGRPIFGPDGRIGALARSRAEVATGNMADFAGCELEVINPWL